MIRSSLLVACLALVSAPSFAAAQSPVLDDRLVVVGGAHLAGEARVRTRTDVPVVGEVETDTSTDLLGGGHVGLQFESPIAEFFILAYRFAAVRYNVDDNVDRNRTWFDFGIAPTAALQFAVGSLAIEPRLGMPLGFSLHHWNKDDPDSDEVARNNAGFHIGVLAGVHLGASRASGGLGRLGGLIELGMVHHSAFAGSDDPDSRYHLSMNQFVLQAGLSLSL